LRLELSYGRASEETREEAASVADSSKAGYQDIHDHHDVLGIGSQDATSIRRTARVSVETNRKSV